MVKQGLPFFLYYEEIRGLFPRKSYEKEEQGSNA
ncbi:hypothetical protein RUMTOR_01269 [[Ruminococcus] torques ATCC 27756]|uniref:Uncharacterized protein n=1 Tax=[Ruminococcus] torques ATCC 27756 TaxID=411460 RepID=A5KM13_9FIRM|nr:hypothetical protein RUMTOR_01269 [[Ruminococcus] torques ATCC 27756]